MWFRVINVANFKLHAGLCVDMMTSSNGNISRVTSPLCGEFTGPGEFPTQRPVTRALMFSLICVWINGWVNNREAGDLRRYRGHYDVILMNQHVSIGSGDGLVLSRRQATTLCNVVPWYCHALYAVIFESICCILLSTQEENMQLYSSTCCSRQYVCQGLSL